MKSTVQHQIRRFHRLALRRAMPRQVALYFHALDPPHRNAFAELVRHFQAQGYAVAAGPDDFLAPSSERVLWLSFDDNFRSWYTARDLFDELGIRCTFYINTGVFQDVAPLHIRRWFFQHVKHDGEKRALATQEMIELRTDGHVIGAHTHTHPALSQVSPRRARAEILQSKLRLEALLNEPVEHFAYPFGLRRYFDDTLIGYCQSIGLRTVARAIPSLLHTEQGPTVLHRHPWRFDRTFEDNLLDLEIDGRVFERLTGRSAVG